MFEDILGGFVTLFSDDYAIWFVVLAAFVGIVFGALPGLTAAAAIAMMLPILIAYNDEIGGLAGLAFLVLAAFAGHSLLGENGERAVTLLGAGFIALAHIRNYKLCRNLDCNHH